MAFTSKTRRMPEALWKPWCIGHSPGLQTIRHGSVGNRDSKGQRNDDARDETSQSAPSTTMSKLLREIDALDEVPRASSRVLSGDRRRQARATGRGHGAQVQAGRVPLQQHQAGQGTRQAGEGACRERSGHGRSDTRRTRELTDRLHSSLIEKTIAQLATGRGVLLTAVDNLVDRATKVFR
jgi:hypothetical protein